MRSRLLALLQRLSPGPPPGPAGRRLSFGQHPAAVYAIGDIHGCLDLLVALEAQIAADAATLGGESWLVTLGDAIDRGPASAQVIDHLRGPAPAGMQRLNLLGNHEAMLLEFIARPRPDAAWLQFGGLETLASYGVPYDSLRQLDARRAGELLRSYIPAEHLDYLRALPVLLETPRAVFVHAGLRPGVAIAAQQQDDLLWYRDEFRADYAEFGKPVVHGHTMRAAPLVTPFRIAIDTAAVVGGPLTAVRIARDGSVRLFSAAAQ
jgi:serine/threonine protein phosphatase 1